MNWLQDGLPSSAVSSQTSRAVRGEDQGEAVGARGEGGGGECVQPSAESPQTGSALVASIQDGERVPLAVSGVLDVDVREDELHPGAGRGSQVHHGPVILGIV